MPVNNAALFDTHIIVDWSASNTPKRGKDSIWIGETRLGKDGVETQPPVNLPTRSAAMAEIRAMLDRAMTEGRRVFIGFDFPFGYPAGIARILSDTDSWQSLWRDLAHEVEDGDDNRSNRYALADRWNREKFGMPVFWGRPHQHHYDHLPAKKPMSGLIKTHEFRTVECWQPPAKSLWQLAYNGAVGSQAILGIARLEHLRRGLKDRARIWPFQTDWAEKLDTPITIAEVYPSMITPQPREAEVKDAAQVRTMAQFFAQLDHEGQFNRLLSRPEGLSEEDNDRVLREEGWIIGAGHAMKRV